MERLKKLLEARARAFEQMKSLTDKAGSEDRNMTGEERQEWERLEAEIREHTSEITVLERQRTLTDQLGRIETDPIVNGGNPTDDSRSTEGNEEQYRSAFIAWARGGMGDLDPEQRQVLRGGFIAPGELRAQGVGTNSAGGYLVPAGFRNNLIRTMLAYGAVQQVATIIETDSGATLPWPTVNDTSNVGVILAENTQMAEQDVTLGTANLDAYLLSSKLTRVSIQLLQDSAIDPEELVPSLHGERLGRGANVYLTTGTGSSQPDGIVTNASTGVTAAGAAAITSDEIIDLVHSVDPAYRSNGAFMMADATLAKIRKLKASGSGEYLWQPSVQAGVPDTLFGFPVLVNPQMPAATTGNKSVLFGDFKAGYVVRLVRGVQTIRFEERYMDYLQVGFTSFLRFDGTQQNASAYKALVQA